MKKYIINFNIFFIKFYFGKRKQMLFLNLFFSDLVNKVASVYGEPEDFMYNMGSQGYVHIINNINFDCPKPVSYTHLTLPTILLV